MNDLAWCRERTRDMTGLLEQLVAIESPSTDPGGVAELARHLARELEPLGLQVQPTLDGLGADGDGAHAADEHVLIPSLPDRAALAAGLIARLSGSSEPRGSGRPS